MHSLYSHEGLNCSFSTLKNAILVFSIRYQSSSFIFQISSFITQILLKIFQNYNLTKLVNSLHIVLLACVKLCHMTSFFRLWYLSLCKINQFWFMINQTFTQLLGRLSWHGWLEGRISWISLQSMSIRSRNLEISN